MSRCRIKRIQLTLYMALVQLSYSCVTCHSHIADTDPDGDPENPLRNKDFVLDKEHVMEHMEGKINYDHSIDETEVAFQFFSSHDTDSDGRLDGLELYYALEHRLEDTLDRILGKDPGARKRAKQNLRDSYVRAVDRMLREDDTDSDGYLSYMEFSKARVTDRIATSTINLRLQYCITYFSPYLIDSE
ncbi:hypothetical protein LSH36_92g02038 [Paralvinella palmiformis]|uniref:EF-hand domain-containing protein n=1 Tax=Paralvinella palmiformis TaxID=53620 RepID=A0AAD9K0Y9_9ANNE|nr:hypothetical protein LSH36_92g02038 [Paralvinella palmiformis]